MCELIITVGPYKRRDAHFICLLYLVHLMYFVETDGIRMWHIIILVGVLLYMLISFSVWF